jgi:hypothetical protein
VKQISFLDFLFVSHLHDFDCCVCMSRLKPAPNILPNKYNGYSVKWIHWKVCNELSWLLMLRHFVVSPIYNYFKKEHNYEHIISSISSLSVIDSFATKLFFFFLYYYKHTISVCQYPIMLVCILFHSFFFSVSFCSK